MADYSNTLKAGTAIETWNEAKDDAELNSTLTSGDTYTLTLESDAINEDGTCDFNAADWAGVNIIIKSDVKYTKRFSYMRTAGVPSGDEHIQWNQGGAGTLDMSDIIFDTENNDSPFGHIRNNADPTGQQLYERVAFVQNSGRAINNCDSQQKFVNCFFFGLSGDAVTMTGTGPLFIYCTDDSPTGNNDILNVLSNAYNNELRNVIGTFDPDTMDLTPDADTNGSLDTSASIFTPNAQNKALDTTRFESVTFSVANINNKTFFQIKKHTSDASMYGLVGAATTFAEPTDDFYGNTRDTADRDIGATAIAPSVAGVNRLVDRNLTKSKLFGSLAQ